MRVEKAAWPSTSSTWDSEARGGYQCIERRGVMR